MIKLEYILFGAAVLLFASFADAVSLEGSCSSVAYQCDLSVKDLTVCNDSTATDSYSVRVSGEVAKWVNVIPESMTLAPGECRQLHVYTIAECYADPGTYGVDITVSDGGSATVHCEIVIQQGHEIDVEIIPESQTATQCEEKAYNVRLTNTGKIQHQQTENVYLDIIGIEQGWITLESSNLLVTKGAPEDVELRVVAPCDSALGTYPFEAVATLINPNFFYTDSGNYILTQGQVLDVDLGLAGQDLVACREVETSQTITITNMGRLADTAELSLEAPAWVGLSDNSLSLQPGESKTVELVLDDTTAGEGDYTATVKARSAQYGVDTTETVSIELQDCYGLIVEKISGEDRVCIETPPTYVFRVTNTGTIPADAGFAIDGIQAALDAGSAVIPPGGSVNVTATLDVSGLAQPAQVVRHDKAVALEVMMDTSGSMVERIGEQSKMQMAKVAITSFVNAVSDVELGLRVFGQGELCEGSEQLYDVSALNIPGITAAINSMGPRGKTPIAEAMQRSVLDFPSGTEKYIIMVSDGKETCGGNLDSAARMLRDNKITVYAIGFDIDEEGRGQLQNIASITGGRYYDASNADELTDMFERIGVELNIIPAGRGVKDFTFSAATANVSAEKQFSVTVEDCYNLMVIAPAINVCRSLETAAVLEVRNLGTREQAFTISVSPSWITTEGSMTLAGNTAITTPLTARPGDNAQETELSIVVTSPNTTTGDVAGITYLPKESCFAIAIINPNEVIDADACAGQAYKISIENQGVAGQTVTLTVDKPWVYLDDTTITLGRGERRDVYFIISPPYDITEERTTITITATTDRGTSAQTAIKLNIFGAGFGIHPIEFTIRGVEIVSLSREPGKISQFEFVLQNDTNRTLKIYSLEAMAGLTADFEIADNVLGPGASTAGSMSVVLPEPDANTLSVPIKFSTDKGLFASEFHAVLPAEAVDVNAGMGPTGLVGLGSLGGVLIGVLAGIVILLVLYGILKSRPAPAGKGAKDAKPKADTGKEQGKPVKKAVKKK